MSDESSIARDVLIDVSELSLADVPGNGDTSLFRALRRYLTAGDETGVIAEWNQRV